MQYTNTSHMCYLKKSINEKPKRNLKKKLALTLKVPIHFFTARNFFTVLFTFMYFFVVFVFSDDRNSSGEHMNVLNDNNSATHYIFALG